MNDQTSADKVSKSFKPVNHFRMSRREIPHMQDPGQTYFITFRTNEIVMPEKVRTVVMDTCLFWDEQKCNVHTCVVMPDHVHIILTPLEILNEGYYSITAIVHSIKTYSAKKANRIMNWHGEFWQREYFDRIIRSESDLLEKWNYIRNNPVKNGLVECAKDYPFFYEAHGELL